MSAEPVTTWDELFCVGSVCRSRNAIIKAADDETSRLCKIVGMVPQEWWRRADTPEYKVRMLAFPITAIRRGCELQPIDQVANSTFRTISPAMASANSTSP